MMERSRRKNQYSSSLAAAALQDHITRQIRLEDPSGHVKKKKRPLQPAPGSSRKTKETLCTKCNTEGWHGECEYTLDPAPPPLTLAQSLGLVNAPQQLLTADEWEGVKVCSNRREDSRQPCPICQEEFGLSQQVLLSCSHVFHLTCLKSFEKFSRSKRCPLCRTEGYQTRVICDGAREHRTRAAILIQSAWRRYRVQRWYQEYRQSHPPTHPALRRKHFESKLSRLTQQLMMSCDIRAEGVASVLSESDRALEEARSVMRALDCESAPLSEGDWADARDKAAAHLTTDCAVCLTPLLPPSQPHTFTPSQPHTSTPSQPQLRSLSLLSCGHLLHTSCINSLESYSGSCVHLCPLCRSPYQRTLFL